MKKLSFIEEELLRESLITLMIIEDKNRNFAKVELILNLMDKIVPSTAYIS